MKNNSTKRKYWTSNEEEALTHFLQENASELIKSFYDKINKINIKARKKNIFKKMSLVTGKTPKQCKSKLQKFERKAYVQILGIPAHHFDFYEQMRQKKFLLKNLHCQEQKLASPQIESQKARVLKEYQESKELWSYAEVF
jgi:DNA-binding protein